MSQLYYTLQVLQGENVCVVPKFKVEPISLPENNEFIFESQEQDYLKLNFEEEKYHLFLESWNSNDELRGTWTMQDVTLKTLDFDKKATFNFENLLRGIVVVGHIDPWVVTE